MSTSYRKIAKDLFFRMRALNKAAEQAEREGESGEAIRWRRVGVEEACMIVFGQGTGVELVKLSIDTHELLHEQAEVAVWNFISEKLPAEAEAKPEFKCLHYELGLPVKDRNGRTGVVVGYQEGNVLVREAGVPSTETPPPVALAPEHLAPVHPRPPRHELLAALEGLLLDLLRSRPSRVGDDAIKQQVDAALALAQARALL